jgi:crossover junction endodeoxyribonuclease RuvC
MILGIDPGLSGGFALVGATGTLYQAYPTPVTKKGELDLREIVSRLADQNISHAYVEFVTSRPRQAGQFQFGINTGAIHGILAALDIPMTLVTSAKWKSQYGIKRQHDETYAEKKTEARQIAMQRFPEHAHLFKRVKDDGPAEAALIALYGLSLYINN